MQHFLLRKEKWYHSNFLLVQNNEIVGEFKNETFKKGYTLNIKGINYTIEKGNIWKNEKFLVNGNVRYGEIIEKPFKSMTLLSFANGQELKIKKNSWKSITTLLMGEKPLGEIRSKSFRHEISVGDDMPPQIVAAFILSTIMQQNAAVVFIALLPVWIAVFS